MLLLVCPKHYARPDGIAREGNQPVGPRYRRDMRMVAEYLEKAVNFEALAAQETDAKLKAELLAQASYCRRSRGFTGF